MLGKIEGKRRRGQQRKRWLYSITDSMGMNLSKLGETVEDRGVWCAAVHGSQRVRHDLVAEKQEQHGRRSKVVHAHYDVSPCTCEETDTGKRNDLFKVA